MRTTFSKKSLVILSTMLLSFSSLALKLENIRELSRADKVELKRRYPEYSSNPQLFSEEQFQSIEDNRLVFNVAVLILHPYIKLTGAQELIDYAQTVSSSGYSFARLEPRILKYVKKKMFPFDALELAIKRQRQADWKKGQIQKIRDARDSFVDSILQLQLEEKDEEKVISVYAVCVAPFTDSELRPLMKPTVCEPQDNFKRPRHNRKKPRIRTGADLDNSLRERAYWELMAASNRVADGQGLDVFERIKMSKCIAEQALLFFQPIDHPLKSLGKLVELSINSPEDAFFEESGVCANFSGMIYNVANELGLRGKVHLARKKVHVYVEFEEENAWYHVHPFNSQGRCDITKF